MPTCSSCGAVLADSDYCRSCGWRRDQRPEPEAAAVTVPADVLVRRDAVQVAGKVLATIRPDGTVDPPAWPGDVAQLAHYIVTGERDGMEVPKRGEG